MTALSAFASASSASTCALSAKRRASVYFSAVIIRLACANLSRALCRSTGAKSAAFASTAARIATSACATLFVGALSVHQKQRSGVRKAGPPQPTQNIVATIKEQFRKRAIIERFLNYKYYGCVNKGPCAQHRA